MLRISTLIESAINGGENVCASRARRGATAPIVIWNLTRNCNLTCVHCYAAAQPRQFSGELSPAQALAAAESMAEAGVRMVVLSGGEPLYREDIYRIARRLKEAGVMVSLSSNGTLIDKAAAEKIAAAGFSYVGISLDGLGEAHDRFRGLPGSFGMAVEGVKNVKSLGIKSGIRYTITRLNIDELEGIFHLAEYLGADKLYFSHLVYSGRGNGLKERDLTPEHTRLIMDYILDKAVEYALAGRGPEIVTGNNDADAVYLYMRVAREWPLAADRILDALKVAGGASAGIGVANIDPRGEVHPDPLMSSVNLGNVTRDSFRNIWFNNPDPTLAKLRKRPGDFSGRCGRCAWLAVCGGSARVRAQRMGGSLWGSDPACYLTEEEIASGMTHAFA